MRIFEKKYHNRKFDGYTLLAPDLNIESIPYKYVIAYYCQIYEKIIEILDIIYSEYSPNENTFVPVDDSLEVLFQELNHFIIRIDAYQEFENFPRTLIGNFKLNGNFRDNISRWLLFKHSYYKDSINLKKSIRFMYPLPPDVILNFSNIDKLLIEHKNNKEEELNKKKGNILYWQDLQLNISKAILIYKKNKPLPISFNQAIRLLEYLLINKGEIKEYIEIARYLNLNSLSSDSENIDIARNIQFIKKQLVKILRDTGMKNNDIKKMITSVTNKGYIIN